MPGATVVARIPSRDLRLGRYPENTTRGVSTPLGACLALTPNRLELVMKMKLYEVETQTDVIRVQATCLEAAELEVEATLGPVISVKQVEVADVR